MENGKWKMDVETGECGCGMDGGEDAGVWNIEN
jgi:hypothetical protein